MNAYTNNIDLVNVVIGDTIEIHGNQNNVFTITEIVNHDLWTVVFGKTPWGKIIDHRIWTTSVVRLLDKVGA